jgi:hypothetical protein
MKALNCNSCRKKIHEEERDLFLKQQYAVFKDMSTSFAAYAITTVLMTMVKRGRTKEYIQKLFDDMVFIFDTPAVMGKEISMHDCMKLLENEYGIDWDRINVSIESEKEFIRAVQKR